MHQAVRGVVQEGKRLQEFIDKVTNRVEVREQLDLLLKDILQRDRRRNFRHDVELLNVAEAHPAEVQNVRVVKGPVRPNELQPAQGSWQLLHGDVLMRSEVVPHQQRVPGPLGLVGRQYQEPVLDNDGVWEVLANDSVRVVNYRVVLAKLLLP